MWYAIISEDVENSLELRKKTRDAHLDRVRVLVGEDRVLIGGPHPAVDSPDPGSAGFTGSLIVADFPSLEDATKWADDDPYVAAGVYRKVTVKPFVKVVP